MSIHNICFQGEIRKNINTFRLEKASLLRTIVCVYYKIKFCLSCSKFWMGIVFSIRGIGTLLGATLLKF